MSNPSLEREFEIYASVVRGKLAESKRDAMASDFVQAVTAGRAAIDGLKTLASYADEVKDVSKRGEFMRIIGELSLELAQVQMKLATQITENNNLEEKIKSLKEEIQALREPEVELFKKDGFYFDPGDEDSVFCPNCYLKKEITMVSEVDINMAGTRYECQKCKYQKRRFISDK